MAMLRKGCTTIVVVGVKTTMTSIKEYAKANHITYEAARKQVKQYADELRGHIVTRNRTQYLDDEAVALLDEHRRGSPVVVYNQDREAALEQLRQENKALLQQVAALQDRLLTAQDSALEAAKQSALLVAAEADKDRLQARCEALEAELAAARRPWWQRLAKK